MNHPRSIPRPTSSSRLSFESRTKSPLSITSSADSGYASSINSEDFFSTSARAKADLALGTAVPPKLIYEGRPAESAWTRYSRAEHGKLEHTLNTPQKLSTGSRQFIRTSINLQYSPRRPGEAFKKLPEEILLVIVEELRRLHLDTGSLSCSTCLMRDLVSLGLSCKKWWSAAKIALYEDISLNGSDSLVHTKKKFKVKYGARLMLLRRTLRDRPGLAKLVKSLKVPSMSEIPRDKGEHEQYLDLVATIIMACPSLERLPGFYPAHNHTFNRFVHALSTRSQLKEKVWVINPSPYQRQRRYLFEGGAPSLAQSQEPALLLPEQCDEFLSFHSNWDNLKTLFLHCNTGGMIDSRLFSQVCNRLPSLENLHVSSFPATSFNDSVLVRLPPLKSLRLDNLPGITAAGLWTFASLPSSALINSLALISLPLLSLPAISRLFSRLGLLTRFTISQAPSPVLPAGEEVFLHPYLASRSLKYLHWEITNPDDGQASEIIRKSIAHGGFPSLRTVRAPTDFDGSIQKLCRPRQKIELSGDRYRNLGAHTRIPSSQSLPNMPARPNSSIFGPGHGHSTSVSSAFIKSPTRSSFSVNFEHESSDDGQSETREKGMSLVTARRMAQHRIESAVLQPKFHIIVWDEEGNFVERYTAGGFIGSVRSKIEYLLTPDIEGMDESVVTIDGVGGLLDGGEERSGRGGCTGSWNLGLVERGKKDRWWHTERGRWREVRLKEFF